MPPPPHPTGSDTVFVCCCEFNSEEYLVEYIVQKVVSYVVTAVCRCVAVSLNFKRMQLMFFIVCIVSVLLYI